jgi:ABC-type spermidine/putrescine transport system permease subunit I
VFVHLVTKSIVLKALPLAPAFRNMDASLEEASKVAGVNTARTLIRLIVPIMALAIIVVVILSTITALEAFDIESILGGPIGF